MKSYMFGDTNSGDISVNTYTYADMEYNNFSIKEVLYSNKPTGEYHIKFKNGIDTNEFADALSLVLGDDCEIITLDTSLLDFNLTLKIDTEKYNIDDILSGMDSD